MRMKKTTFGHHRPQSVSASSARGDEWNGVRRRVVWYRVDRSRIGAVVKLAPATRTMTK
jgi:hypothetical protein